MSSTKDTAKTKKKPEKTRLTAVSADRPCEVCGKDHKCSYGDDGLIVCGRSKGGQPEFTYHGQSVGDDQFALYRRCGDVPAAAGVDDDHVAPPKPPVDWKKRTERYQKHLTPERAEELALALGLPTGSLRLIGAGWDASRNCWTIPEQDGSGTVTGISRRYPDGQKRVMAGGSRGLYYELDWHETNGPILCPEGSSDTATLIALNLPAVGRPSNTGGVELLEEMFMNLPAKRTIIIIGEHDQKPDGRWPGKEGAVSTAEQLARRLNRPVLVAFPPDGEKDIRSWFLKKNPALGDVEGLERLGESLSKALLEGAREIVIWDPLLGLDDPELPGFPVDALADWQRSYVAALAEATQTPVDLAAALVLTVTSVATAKKAVVRVRDGYEEPLNTFIAVSQPPASRKTSVFRDVVHPIEAFERDRAKEVMPIAAERRAQKEIAQKSLEQLQGKASKAVGDECAAFTEAAKELAKEISEMTVPEIPRLVADDVTNEKLASLMAAQGGRIGVLSPEGGIFGILGGRYSNGKNSANLSIFLKGHAGDTLRVDRQNRPPEFIDRPALTVGLAVQPDVIRGLTQNPAFRGQGLLARFLYVLPESRVGRRNIDPSPVPAAIRERYRQRVRSLLDLPFASDDSGAPIEHVIYLSPEAYAIWLEFSDWLEPQLADFSALAYISDWAGKLAGAVGRIAGLLHLSDHAGGQAAWELLLPAPTMSRAIAIGKYLIPHACAAFAEMGCDPAVADARHVLGWVRRNGAESFNRRDSFERTKSRFETVENLQAALRTLERHNYVRERVAHVKPGRGRPSSPVYDVNPQVFKTEGPTTSTFMFMSAKSATTLGAPSGEEPAEPPTGSSPDVVIDDVPIGGPLESATLVAAAVANNADAVESDVGGSEPTAGKSLAAVPSDKEQEYEEGVIS